MSASSVTTHAVETAASAVFSVCALPGVSSWVTTRSSPSSPAVRRGDRDGRVGRSVVGQDDRDRTVVVGNDLADADHLNAILLGENRSKGDGGPEQWKSPAPASWCHYALAWDHVKATWGLTATPAEWSALVAMAATC